jgi:UDP-N-acetylglucosamine 2-epimerase
MIGPIQYKNLPHRLMKHFDEFAEMLSGLIQEEFNLPEKPVVVAKSYSNVGRVEAQLHASLVGMDYGKLLHLVTHSLFDFAEDKGTQILEIFAA